MATSSHVRTDTTVITQDTPAILQYLENRFKTIDGKPY